MRRILPFLLLAVFCLSTTACTRRTYRYYAPDSKNIPENLKPKAEDGSTPAAAPSPTPTPTTPLSPEAQKKAEAEAKAKAELDALMWVPATDERFTVSGLHFFKEDGGKWQRFPNRAKGVIPDKVWGLSQSPSGGRIRFRSNTTALALRVVYPLLPNMRNMHAFGQAGIDVYIDGGYRGTLAPRKDLEVEGMVFKELEKGVHDLTLYLPLYMGVDVKSIGLDPGATIEPPTPFAIEKPIVYYGTSITQGGCASHPAASYQAMLSRRLNVDFVNFGFSGAGKGEKEVIELVAEVDAACFVMDMAQNNPTAEDLESYFGPALDILRSRHPETPILCNTPIYAATEFAGFEGEKILPAMREVIRKAVNERREKGDKNIHLVEGYALLGPDQGDGFVDGVHPNDLGFHWMANGLEPRLRRVLALPDGAR